MNIYMNNTQLTLLERRFEAVKKSGEDFDFITNLSEYIKHVKRTPFNSVVEKIEKERDENYKELDFLKSKITKELNESRIELFKIIEENKINFDKEDRNNLFLISEKVKKIKDGFKENSLKNLYETNSSLFEITVYIAENYSPELVKKFIDETGAVSNTRGNYCFSSSYLSLEEKLNEINCLKKDRIWECWYKLKYVPDIIPLTHRDSLSNFKGEDNENYYADVYHLKNQLESGSLDRLSYSTIQEFRQCLERLHLYIVEQANLEEIGALNIQNNILDFKNSNLDFNKQTSTLYFGGKKIIISTRVQNDAHDLLSIIFEDKNNLSKTWNNDEVLDKWKFEFDGKAPKNKVYQAGMAVNRAVAQETTIKDFLLVNTKNIALNKKYLPEKSL